MTVTTNRASTRRGSDAGRSRPTADVRRRVCRALGVASLCVAAAVATACGAGQISQTADQVPAVDGNEGHAGTIQLRDVRFDFPGAPGADAAYTNKRGGNAVLLFSAVNNSPDTPDTLVSITTDVGTAKVTSPEGPNPTLPPLQSVNGVRPAGEPPVTTGNNATDRPIQVEIDNLTRDLVPGLPTELRFTFARNGSVTLSVPVDPANTPRQITPKSPGDS